VKVFSKKQLYLLSLLSGVLLWLGWPAHGFSFLLLIGFVPLLIIEEQLYQERDKYRAFSYFRYAYLAMVSWNALTTWWVGNATIFGGIVAIVCNALFMALVLVLFHFVRIKTAARTGYAALLFFWISFEYLHLNWELSWPWLTLGNGFANYAGCVQWYELTGALGGTLWILTCNVLIFYIIKFVWLSPWKGGNTQIKRLFIGTIALIAFPLLYSAIPRSAPEGKKVNVVVLQPNIDPYNEKFSEDFKTQLTKMLELANSAIDSTTDYLVMPETALTENIDESRWNESYSIHALRDFLIKHPHLSIVTGAVTYKVYGPNETVPESAHKIENSNEYFDDFNTAIEVDNGAPVQVYHKSKLVPGVEKMPFQKLLAPLTKLAFDLGGTAGTLGTQEEPSVFVSPNSKTTIGAAVCYESIYGEYIGEYVQKGAQLIFIITNDGWWQDTPGYRQHLSYARLRAIEDRRCIARSANTGISAFIDENGNILQKTAWWQPATLKATLTTNNKLTFYAAHGDYIGRFACLMSILVLGVLVIAIFRGSNKN
jgi:apolipoprotein N-acyltransferase